MEIREIIDFFLSQGPVAGEKFFPKEEEFVIELTNDGFIVKGPLNVYGSPDTYVQVYEFQKTVFVTVRSVYPPDYGGFSATHGGMAYNQEEARKVYNTVVNQLLAA